MIKKNLWVAALLTALALTAFSIGCIEPLAESGDTGTYREVEIKEFNAWGGNALFQAGWGTDGAKWDSGKKEVKSIGLSIDDLQAAKYLVVEVNDGFPKNNFETIWDGWDADGNKTGDWAQFSQVTSAAGELNPGMGTREGNILKLEMAKIIKDYSLFRNKSTVAITLLIQHWGNGGTAACIKSAKLLVSDEPVPSVGVGNVFLMSNEMYWTNDFVLEAEVVPADATNQSVTWAIESWTPAGGGTTLSLPKLDLNDSASVTAYEAAKKVLLEKINWKQEIYVIDNGVIPNTTAYRNIPGVISVPLVNGVGTASLGTVRLTAIVKNGRVVGENFSDYTKSGLTFTIKDPPLFVFKVGGVDQKTIWYGAVDNKGGGASGGKMEVTPTAGVTPAEGTSFTSTFGPGGGYANSRHYVEVNLGAGKKLSDFSKVTLHYKGEDETKKDGGDLAGKSIRLRASATKPDAGSDYNFGAYISTTSFPGGYANGWDTDIEFVLFEDNALNSDGDTKNGIYRKGVGADLRLAATDEGNAASYELVKDESIVYIWILPWNGGKTTFTISDVKFIAK